MFFHTLYACLIRGARAVLQFYPDSSDQVDLLLMAAHKAGFSGGLVIDFPNSTRAKKYFLCLTAGPCNTELSKELGVSTKTTKHKGKKNSFSLKSKILAKKERQRRQGREVRPDSKYTGRKRSGKLR